MTFEVVRSPAKVCWWVLCNGVLLLTTDTKKEASAKAEGLRRQYV